MKQQQKDIVTCDYAEIGRRKRRDSTGVDTVMKQWKDSRAIQGNRKQN
jgi:hypothetical protein